MSNTSGPTVAGSLTTGISNKITWTLGVDETNWTAYNTWASAFTNTPLAYNDNEQFSSRYYQVVGTAGANGLGNLRFCIADVSPVEPKGAICVKGDTVVGNVVGTRLSAGSYSSRIMRSLGTDATAAKTVLEEVWTKEPNFISAATNPQDNFDKPKFTISGNDIAATGWLPAETKESDGYPRFDTGAIVELVWIDNAAASINDVRFSSKYTLAGGVSRQLVGSATIFSALTLYMLSF